MNGEMIYAVTSVYLEEIDVVETSIEYQNEEYIIRTDGVIFNRNRRVVTAHIVGQVLHAIASSS